MTTQPLSGGEFYKLRYDTIHVKSESANVSFYTNNSKMPKFWVVTILSQMGDTATKQFAVDVLSVFQILLQGQKTNPTKNKKMVHV